MALRFLTSLSLVYRVVLCQDNRPIDPNNHFVRPPTPGPQANVDPTVFESNTNYTLGEKQSEPWSWITNMTISLYLQQEGNPDDVGQRLLLPCSSSTTNFLYWDGKLTNIDYNVSNIFFLSAYNCSAPSGSTPVFFSHYFNVTKAPVSSTSSASSSSSASSTSSHTKSASATSATSSSSSTSSSSGNGGSDNGGAIGGGIGGGIGGALLLLGIGAAIFFWRKNMQNNKKLPPELGQMHTPISTSTQPDYSYNLLQNQAHQPSSPNHPRSELSGQGSTPHHSDGSAKHELPTMA